MGRLADSASPEIVIAATTSQKLPTSPITTNISTLMLMVISNADVRRRKAPRIRSVSRPPTIAAPALIAATRPAIP